MCVIDKQSNIVTNSTRDLNLGVNGNIVFVENQQLLQSQQVMRI